MVALASEWSTCLLTSGSRVRTLLEVIALIMGVMPNRFCSSTEAPRSCKIWIPIEELHCSPARQFIALRPRIVWYEAARGRSLTAPKTARKGKP